MTATTKPSSRFRGRLAAPIVMIATAALVLTLIAGFNLYIDSAGVLRDQTSTANVREYVTALRSAKVGLPYSNYDRPIKLELAATSKADCLVTGSSHVMTLGRGENATIAAECTALDNAALSAAGFEDVITIMGAGVSNPNVKHIFVGIDIWTFTRSTSPRWRRNTLAFMTARKIFGLPNGPYDLIEDEDLDGRVREAFSLEYLRVNYRYLLRALRGRETLFYSARELGENDLRDQEALRADGSISQPQEFQSSPSDADLAITDDWAEPPFYDPQVLEEMRRAIEVIQQAGKRVTFVISPYHPAVFKCEKPKLCAGMRVMDPVIRDLAAQLHVPVIGAFDPEILGLGRDSFIDFQHLRGATVGRLRILQPPEIARALARIPALTN